jgi:hypothetical protein
MAWYNSHAIVSTMKKYTLYTIVNDEIVYVVDFSEFAFIDNDTMFVRVYSTHNETLVLQWEMTTIAIYANNGYRTERKCARNLWKALKSNGFIVGDSGKSLDELLQCHHDSKARLPSSDDECHGLPQSDQGLLVDQVNANW